MQKSFLLSLLTLALFSCSEKEIIAVPQETTVTAVKSAEVFYKDPNITINKVSANQTAQGQVVFSFSTEIEKNLRSVEVYSGASNALMCEIYKVPTNGSSTSTKQYSLVEKNITTAVNYYMIKYTTLDNGWSVSPLFKVELK